MMQTEIAIWFPTVKCETGTDIFTINLVKALNEQGIRAEITWLPLRAEYAPWTVKIPQPPEWATVVHISTWLHPRFIPKDLPVIATLHHSIHDDALTPYKGWLRAAYHRYWIRHIEHATMQRANKVIAVSQFASQIAKKKVINTPIDVIYNGIYTQLYQPPKDRKSNHPFRLLYVGGWKTLKGIDLFPSIMKELGHDFVLYYTGGANAESDKSTMPNNMIDIGRLNEAQVINAMQEADALLFPSRSEGLSLTVLEAMSCGLPVIATRGSSLTEVIIDGENGILCKQDSVADFSQAARKLANNEAFYFSCSNKNHLRVIQKFSFETMCTSYIHLYRELNHM
ncbi:glycosyltransferase family 1 protein [Acinetobacter cumulans]|uniref:glycosyltransferase family 4 protein n=1 Tax=Acinetobacter cumulans TaxID=2136182 RepID=UPI000EA08A1A|nr:glycosyltransferase family 4 protein [Acinetobacter cumulans]RKG51429.1 glycosyltransferase family 1 protein [Acinetobacter cumulans]